MKLNKRGLAAAAFLVHATASWAQSVQIYGILDASVQSYRPAGGGKVTRLNSGDLQTSRLGFNVSEDLGGGNKAVVQLLAGVGVDTGSLGSATGGIFNLGSTVGLAGGWGSFDLGYMRNSMIFPVFAADQTGYGIPNYGVMNQLQHHNVLGTGIGGFYANSVRYRTPSLGGLKVELAASNGDESTVPATRHDKGFGAFNAMYTDGPLFLSVAATEAKVQTTTSNTRVRGSLLAGSYKFSGVSVGGDWTRSSRPGLVQRSWVGTAKVPIPGTPGEIDVAYGRLNETGGKATYAASLGYTYHLSKRTDLYVYTLRMGNNAAGTRGPWYFGTATVAAGASSSAYAAGLRHAF